MMLVSLPPVVDADTRLLILGSMPGELSLRRQQYYAHPGNVFWRIMSELIGVDPAADYPTRLDALRAAGIGLWDVLHTCERPGSLDASIVDETSEPNDFADFFAQWPAITRVFFNGAKAEKVFQQRVSLRLPVALARLPATSPANPAASVDDKHAAWRALLS